MTGSSHNALSPAAGSDDREVRIPPLGLPGTLHLPRGSAGLVVFAHGSGSSRFSPRNRLVADALNGAGLGTLLFDLLTPEEEEDRRNVFDIPLLANRLIHAVASISKEPSLAHLPIGLFGASTGAAAALVAAAELGGNIDAVVSRGGRPDLADRALDRVRAPTLLIVGGDDVTVLQLNELALARLTATKALKVIPGASHLFPEPGAMEAVIAYAIEWFSEHLRRHDPRAAAARRRRSSHVVS